MIVLQAGGVFTLGGWHLLDGLVACDSIEACEKDCAVLRRRICEGDCAHPVGITKSNSSSCDARRTGLAGDAN